jgi:hypothetical protein
MGNKLKGIIVENDNGSWTVRCELKSDNGSISTDDIFVHPDHFISPFADGEEVVFEIVDGYAKLVKDDYFHASKEEGKRSWHIKRHPQLDNIKTENNIFKKS